MSKYTILDKLIENFNDTYTPFAIQFSKQFENDFEQIIEKLISTGMIDSTKLSNLLENYSFEENMSDYDYHPTYDANDIRFNFEHDNPEYAYTYIDIINDVKRDLYSIIDNLIETCNDDINADYKYNELDDIIDNITNNMVSIIETNISTYFVDNYIKPNKLFVIVTYTAETNPQNLTEIIHTIKENWTEEYQDIFPDVYFNSKKAFTNGDFIMTWNGYINYHLLDEIKRLEHHAEGLYHNIPVEHSHVEIWYTTGAELTNI